MNRTIPPHKVKVVDLKIEGERYYVEDIIDEKKENGVQKYHTKWWSFGHDENTWEPEENFEDREVIKAFWARRAARETANKMEMDEMDENE